MSNTSIPRNHPLTVAIGTDTTGPEASSGIYLTTFDPASGNLGEVTVAASYGNSATFLALHPSLPLLYAVGMSDRYPDGSVAVFKVVERALDFFAEAPSSGRTPCHLAIDPSGNLLALANYDDGTTATLALDEQGLPWPAYSVRMIGKGMNPERQEGSHPHGVYFRGTTLHVPDLGLDRIHTWTVKSKTAKLEAEDPRPWVSEPGSGPRHMDFSPDDRHAYVVRELDSSVSALAHEASTGSFTTLQTISTLPEGIRRQNTPAEIVVHPNGKFVYASNRGHDSIAVFARDDSFGTLKRILVAPAGGENPRHFAISPDGSWLLCAHQDSSTIAVLPIDLKSGMVGEATASIACPNPICVLFLR